jgi:hypothetical protein
MMADIRIEVRQRNLGYVQVWDMWIDEYDLQYMLPAGRQIYIDGRVKSFVEEKNSLSIKWEEVQANTLKAGA